jgi:hypothetical protein
MLSLIEPSNYSDPPPPPKNASALLPLFTIKFYQVLKITMTIHLIPPSVFYLRCNMMCLTPPLPFFMRIVHNDTNNNEMK